MQQPNNGRVLAAELFGTLVLMLGGPGTAILLPSLGLLPNPENAVATNLITLLIVSMGFGLALMIMVYVIGPVSGCHINPAVTLGMLIARKVTRSHAVFAWVGQVVGAVAGAAIIFGIANGRDGFQRGQFASNLWSGRYYGLGATIVVEVLFTAILVVVVLSSTGRKFSTAMNGVVIGLTLTLIHLITIPVNNTSVNPARSLGTALFATGDSGALEQLWAFILFPMIGAVVGVVIWLILDDARLEDTMLEAVPGAEATRDTIEIMSDYAVETVEDTVE